MGVKRHGFSLEDRRAFKIIYLAKLHLSKALERIDREIEPIVHIQHWMDFCP